MLSGALVSAGSALTYKAKAYEATLGCAACGVAFFHYLLITNERTKLLDLETSRSVGYIMLTVPKDCECASRSLADRVNQRVVSLRYSDWLATMPLLALELLSMATSNKDFAFTGFYEWSYLPTLVAGLAFAMILCGALALWCFGDFGECRGKVDGWRELARWALYVAGMCCLAVLYTIIFTAAIHGNSPELNEVVGFAWIWAAYPVVFVIKEFASTQHRMGTATEDVVFAALDVVSKAFLSLYVVVAAHRRSAT
jgi:bacteriorhodopsin